MGVRDENSQRLGNIARSHEEARTLFPAYATALALGQAPERHYSPLVAHLRNCPACRADLEELLELVVPAYSGQLPRSASYPQFDLSFLRSPAPRAVENQSSWFIDAFNRLVVEFSDALLESIRQSAYAQAARGGALYHYTPDPAPPNNLGITIDVFASDNRPDVGSVQILLDIPSRDPFDQSGTKVRLWIGNRAWEGSTSATGSITFTDVPLERIAQLRVEISLPVDSSQ